MCSAVYVCALQCMCIRACFVAVCNAVHGAVCTLQCDLLHYAKQSAFTLQHLCAHACIDKAGRAHSLCMCVQGRACCIVATALFAKLDELFCMCKCARDGMQKMAPGQLGELHDTVQHNCRTYLFHRCAQGGLQPQQPLAAVPQLPCCSIIPALSPGLQRAAVSEVAATEGLEAILRGTEQHWACAFSCTAEAEPGQRSPQQLQPQRCVTEQLRVDKTCRERGRGALQQAPVGRGPISKGTQHAKQRALWCAKRWLCKGMLRAKGCGMQKDAVQKVNCRKGVLHRGCSMHRAVRCIMQRDAVQKANGVKDAQHRGMLHAKGTPCKGAPCKGTLHMKGCSMQACNKQTTWH